MRENKGMSKIIKNSQTNNVKKKTIQCILLSCKKKTETQLDFACACARVSAVVTSAVPAGREDTKAAHQQTHQSLFTGSNWLGGVSAQDDQACLLAFSPSYPLPCCSPAISPPALRL